MDFRSQVFSLDALSGVAADALLLVVGGEDAQKGLDPALRALLADALKAGDFEAKAGRSLYLHRPGRVKAARVLFVAAPAAGAKALRVAIASGIGQLKSLGVRHVAVAMAGGGAFSAEHAEAVVTAATDATYTYRDTKPSAPKPPPLSRVTVLCNKSDAKAVQHGVRRGGAVAAGVSLARACANRPGNHCTPTYLAEQARKLGKEHGLKVEVFDRKAVEKIGMGSFLAVAQGSHEPLRFIVASRLTPYSRPHRAKTP